MMPQGTIKDYDEQARAGSLLQDDRTEIFIDQGGRPVARGLRLVTFS
jgi:hypothetical protein